MTGNKFSVPEKTGLGIITAILLGYLAIIFYFRPWVDCDLMEGIFSLNNYLNGLGFHQVFNVGADYKIHQEILSYWAPGEYVYSWGIAHLLHMDLSGGIIFTNIFFLSTGLIAWFYLLRHFGFSNAVIITTIFMLIIQRFFHGFLLKMNGVDIYLIVFSVLTVLLYEKYFAAAAAGRRALYLLLFLLLFLMGLFAKNSFLLFIIASSMFYFGLHIITWVKNRREHVPGHSLFTIVLPGLVGALSAAIFYFSLYAKSRIPFDQKYHAAALQLTPLKISNIFIKPAVQTLGSLFTFDALLFRIPSPDRSYFAYLTDFTWQGILCSIVILVPLVGSIYTYSKARKKESFTWLAIFATVFYMGFFCAAIVRQSEVYAEDRLFLPMMLFLMPVYATTILHGKKALKYPMIAFLIISAGFSALAIPNTFKYYRKSRVVERNDMVRGFLIHSETDNFDELRQLGATLMAKYPKNNLLVTQSTTQFFLTHANMASISVDAGIIKNADSFIAVNDAFLAERHIDKVSVIVPAGTELNTGGRKVIERVRLGSHWLTVVER